MFFKPMFLAFFCLYTVSAHSFCPIPWQDVSCWWAESLPLFYDSAKTTAESSSWLTKLSIACGAFVFGSWFYKAKPKKIKSKSLWFLHKDQNGVQQFTQDLASYLNKVTAISCDASDERSPDEYEKSFKENRVQLKENLKKIKETELKNIRLDKALNDMAQKDKLRKARIAYWQKQPVKPTVQYWQ